MKPIMRFKDLMNVIDYNRSSSEILKLEFKGNDEWNFVRCDCIDILNALNDYIVDSIGVCDGYQTVWLTRPDTADRKDEPSGDNLSAVEDEPQTERSE